MTKYKCGHECHTIIMNDNILGFLEWAFWRETVGFDGTKEQCFDCYLRDRKVEDMVDML
jgi:hypothetical protein